MPAFAMPAIDQNICANWPEQDRDFYIPNKFVFYGDFYCSEWKNNENT
jgi:hypothetical protein